MYSLALQRCFPNLGKGYETLNLSLIFCHPLSSGNVFHSSNPAGAFSRISVWMWRFQSILSLALSQSHTSTKGADLMGANSSESVMSWIFMDGAVVHVFLPASPFSQSFFPSLIVEKPLWESCLPKSCDTPLTWVVSPELTQGELPWWLQAFPGLSLTVSCLKQTGCQISTVSATEDSYEPEGCSVCCLFLVSSQFSAPWHEPSDEMCHQAIAFP